MTFQRIINFYFSTVYMLGLGPYILSAEQLQRCDEAFAILEWNNLHGIQDGNSAYDFFSG